MMTESQIEIRVEKATDRIDARYMRGDLTDAEYKEELRQLDNWANQQYKELRSQDFDFSNQN